MLNLAVAGTLLALVLWKVQPAELRDAFGEFDPWPALLAVMLNLPVLALMTVRGQIILRKLGHSVGFVPLLPISTFGNVLGSLTPAGAGDLLRTPFFRSRHDIPYAHGVAEVIYERGFSLFVLAIGTGVAAATITLPLWGALAAGVGAVLVVFGVPLILAYILERLGPLLKRSENEQPEPSNWDRAFGALSVSLDSLEGLLRDRGTTAGVTLVNVVLFSIMALQLWLVGVSLGFSLTAAESWAIFGAALLAGIVTLLPLGFGTFDVVLAALLGATDQGLDSGAAAALLVRATVTLPLGIAAVISYLYLMSGAGRTNAER